MLHRAALCCCIVLHCVVASCCVVQLYPVPHSHQSTNSNMPRPPLSHSPPLFPSLNVQVVYKDLRDCDNNYLLPDGQPCKNNSAMWDSYNTYSSGHGGCCAAWPGDQSPYGPMGNYFCGNSSAGGWVGFNDPRGNPGDPGYNGSQGTS